MRPVIEAPAKRYWSRSTPSTCCAARRANFFGEAPAPNKRNVATSRAFVSLALRPPLSAFTSSKASRRSTRSRARLNSGSARSLIVFVLGNLIIGSGADCQHLAHRRVGKLVVQPGCDAFCLCDPGDGPAGELVQPAANGNDVLFRQGSSPEDEGHVEPYAPAVDMLERPVLPPLCERQTPGLAIDLAHRLDVLACVGEKALPFFG